MTIRPRALAISSDVQRRDIYSHWLTSAGFNVVFCDGFADAKSILDARPPELLVTEIRLGSYNGLHLVIRGHVRNPEMRAIVIGPWDPVLAAEAHRERATFLVEPVSADAFLRAVSDLENPPSSRRFPRVRVPPFVAYVGDTAVILTELSYEGARMEVAGQLGDLPQSFVLRVPHGNTVLPARWVWRTETSTGVASNRSYGVHLTELNPIALTAWRVLVDGMSDSAAVSG
jgi:hypothetical protein